MSYEQDVEKRKNKKEESQENILETASLLSMFGRRMLFLQLLLKPDSKWNSWLVERSTVGSTWRHDPQKGFRCVLPKGFYEAVYGTTRVYRRLPVEYKRVLLRFLRPNEL